MMGRTAVCLLAAALAAACSPQEAPKRTPPPDAKRIDTAAAARVSGRVSFEGALPQNAPVKMEGDPRCARAHSGGAAGDSYVGEGGGLGNVFVHVKSGLDPQYYFEVPSQPVTLDQDGCLYKPKVIGVRVGQNVEFVNSDPTAHNVHAVANSNQEFNFTQPIQRQRDTRFFTAPEVMVHVKCDIHPWMSAYVGVVDHPYFAVTDADGTFELKDLPAGTYTIEAWHEKLGTRTQQVTVGAKESKEVAFTFTPTT